MNRNLKLAGGLAILILLFACSACGEKNAPPPADFSVEAHAAAEQIASAAPAQTKTSIPRRLARAEGKNGEQAGRIPAHYDPFVIKAKTAFSYKTWEGQVLKAAGAEDRTQPASLLYEAAVKAGLEVGGRYTHLTLPAGVNPGFDVNLDLDADLLVYNPYDFDVTVQIGFAGGQGQAEISGTPPSDWKPPVVTVETEHFAPGKVKLIDYSGSGAPKAGIPGHLISVFVNGKLLYKDFYSPVPEYELAVPSPEELASVAVAGH